MKICIDIQSAVGRRAGVGRYTSSLIAELSPYADKDKISCFYFDFQRNGLPVAVPQAQLQVNRWIPGRIAQKAWKTISWPPFNWFAGKADLYHFPNFILPPLTHGKSIVTIHDLAFLRYPETIEKRNLQYLTARITDTVQRASAIITVSEFSAKEIATLLHVPQEQIFAIHEGLSPHLVRPDDKEIARTKQHHHLKHPYLLCVGTLEPRKNIPFLIDVFEQLDVDMDLVVAGMRGWKDDPIMERMATSSKADQIHYLSYVPEADLPALYAGAALFVFPSIYEGFGFPPLEAMSCGTPVLSSAAASLPEILEPAAVIMPDFDREVWVDRIHAVLSDTSQQDALREKGLQHIKQYTWKACAQKTWDVYRKVAS